MSTKLSLILLLLLAATGVIPASEPVRSEDRDSSPTAGLRIISCVPNLTEILFAIGAGPQVVGVSTWTEYPPEAAKLPQVIDLLHPNLEAALLLEPTLVVGYPAHDPVLAFFRGSPKVRTMALGPVETLAEVDEAILTLGRETGREAEARALVASLPRPRPRSAGAEPGPRVLFVVGSGPGLTQLYVAGHGTYLNELIEGAGARNAIGPELGRYPTLSKEALLQIDPDIVLATARPGQAEARLAEMKREWAALPTLGAVQRGDFRLVADPGILLPGPRSAGYLPVLEKLLQEAGPGAALPAEP